MIRQLVTATAAVGLVFSLSACAPDPQTVTNVAPAVSSFQMPPSETVILDNGLTLMLMPQTEVPLITVNAVVRAGSVADHVAGIASITAQSLLLGNKLASKQETELLVDSLGASLNADSGVEGSYIGADFMTKDAEQMLPLLKAVLTGPTFDQTEYSKLLKNKVAALAQAKESPRAVIGAYFNAQLFADHPYGSPSFGDSESLQNMSLQQVRDFYLVHYQPANTALTIAGDFELAEMKAYVEGLFSDWQGAGAVEALAPEPIEAPNSAKVLLVDKPDAIETTFLIGGMGISRDNPDFVGLQVINTILGGRFTSWLNDELRVNSGLTYGARSGFTSFRDGGTFRISTFTKTSTTEEAIDLALATYARLWEQGIDQATLDSAKAYVKGQFPPDYETTGQLSSLMADMYLFDFGPEFINEFEAKVNGLTLAETERLIDSYFPRDNLQYVLIGRADAIQDIAAKYGEVRRVDMQAPGFAR
ncbi:insulinase family protein [SAR92 clade bacterium H231]|jgi:zinc protease|nr:insulinase family protein [Porticoccaceae bacterium]MCT2532641.1 insulinase family protein [SAR92 clade bacterium H231]MDA7753300.1 insulinase family protein [bacterium]MBT7257689.1 insulinase family protein [Porticoccaceae bacterium]MBT7905736.1 insulinase family protein [Porticoccaceae bacterium]